MIEDIKAWIRSLFYTKREVDQRIATKVDATTYTAGSATPDGYLTITVGEATYRIPVELV